jgi:tRNA pseudouridine55 synthase
MHPASFHGLLVLDKAAGITSRDVVDRAARWFPPSTRIGHTGTLDPLATGVLVVCIGVATRLAEYVQALDKVYLAGLLLGGRSDTDDADGAIEEVHVAKRPEQPDIEACLQGFVGEIDQVPPAYSAAHVTGQRAYKLARKGRAVDLQPRRVRIDAIQVLTYDYPRLVIEVHCGKGTYIRSLARDLGERLGCGAIVQALRRTRVGPFAVADALPLSVDPATARENLLPLTAAVSALPHVTLPDEWAHRLTRGQTVPCPAPDPAGWKPSHEIAVIDFSGRLLAIVEFDPAHNVLLPMKVLYPTG